MPQKEALEEGLSENKAKLSAAAEQQKGRLAPACFSALVGSLGWSLALDPIVSE